MADLRYKGKFGSADGNVYQVRLHDSTFNGSPTEFPLQSVRQIKGRRGTHQFTPIRATTVELAGYKLTTDALDELLGAEVGRFTMEVWRGASHAVLDGGGGELYFKGVVQTDLGEDDTANAISQVQITATDGLSLLRDIAYLDTTGEDPAEYTGRPTHLETIQNCLAKIGYNSAVSVAGHWYPDDGMASEILWEHAEVDQSIFYDADGNPATCYEVIKQILYPYIGILFWREGRFIIVQKSQIGASTYTTSDYDDTGEGTGTTVRGSTSDADSAVRLTGSRIYRPAFGAATVIYNHGNIPSLIEDGDFEDATPWSFGTSGGEIRTSGGTLLTPPRGNIGRGSYLYRRVQRNKVAFIPAFFYGSDPLFTAARDAIKASNRYATQTGAEVQAGDIIALTGRFRIPYNAGGGDQLYNTFFELQIGAFADGYLSRSGTWYTPSGSDDLQAMRSPGTDWEDAGFSLSRDPGEGWYNFTIISEAAPYTGDVRLVLYGTADITSANLDPEGVEWADVAVLIVDENGELRDSISFSGATSSPEPEDDDLVLLIGQGPHPAVPGSVTWDGEDAENWTDGTAGPENHHQLLMRTRLGYQSLRLEQRFETYTDLSYEMGDPVQIDSELYDVVFHEKDLASQDDTIEAVRIRFDDSDIGFTELNEDIGTYVPEGGGSTSVIGTPGESDIIEEKGDLIIGDGEGAAARFDSGEDDGKVLVTDGEATYGWSLQDLTPITTRGDLIVGDGEGGAVRLAAPAYGYIWVSDPTESLGWRAVQFLESEISQDYIGDSGIKRKKVKANAAELSGSGSITSHAWVITGDELPNELIDSDKSTAEASGAPGLRASLDPNGINQIGLHIVNFTPASGGVGGGASAEIWLNPGTYFGGTDLDLYLWWNKSGKTQPAASATYGKNSVYNPTVRGTWKDDDYTDATSNGNDGTATNITNASDSPFGSNLKSFEFNGSSSRINVSDDAALDVSDVVTMELWFKVDANTGTFQVLMAKRNPSTTYNYGAAIILTATDRFDVGFYNSGFKTLPVDWTDYFGATDTWFHVFAELEKSGSNVIARLYKGATLVGTTTHTSTSLPPNSSDLIFGSNSNSSEWFDGHIKAPVLYSEILSSDQKTTRDNNQSDPSTFWDTTEAVESGPFSLSP